MAVVAPGYSPPEADPRERPVRILRRLMSLRPSPRPRRRPDHHRHHRHHDLPPIRWARLDGAQAVPALVAVTRVVVTGPREP
jgi:hypothetical protein